MKIILIFELQTSKNPFADSEDSVDCKQFIQLYVSLLEYFTKIYKDQPLNNYTEQQLLNFRNDLKLMIKLYYSYNLLNDIILKNDNVLDDYKIDMKILYKQYVRICDDIDNGDEDEDIIFNKMCDIADSVLLVVEKVELSNRNEILKSSFRRKLSNDIIQIYNNAEIVMNMEISKMNEIFVEIQNLVSEVYILKYIFLIIIIFLE